LCLHLQYHDSIYIDTHIHTHTHKLHIPSLKMQWHKLIKKWWITILQMLCIHFYKYWAYEIGEIVVLCKKYGSMKGGSYAPWFCDVPVTNAKWIQEL
jgi:hypothetical protein